MIKRVSLAIAIVILLSSMAFAKKEKTAAYTDSILTDLKYGYTLQVTENWKVKTFNEPEIKRAFLEKKNYSVNRMAQSYGGDYTIPTIVIFAQEYPGSVSDFEALIKQSLEEHKADNQIISSFGLLRDADFVASGDVTVDSLPGRQLVLKRNYTRVLSSDTYGRSSRPGENTDQVIKDHEIHEIFLVKKGDVLYAVQAFCEREFYRENKPEFDAVMLSFKFSR